MVTTKLLTAHDLWNMGGKGRKYELIRGELIEVSPAGGTHGAILIKLGRIIGDYVSEHRLGRVYGGDVGFIFDSDPDTVLGPDIAFVAKERIPQDDSGFVAISPDLAIEIVSPSNAAREIERKIGLYLASGVRQVWIVSPKSQEVVVHAPAGFTKTFGVKDRMSGGDVLPGLWIDVAAIFDV